MSRRVFAPPTRSKFSRPPSRASQPQPQVNSRQPPIHSTATNSQQSSSQTSQEDVAAPRLFNPAPHAPQQTDSTRRQQNLPTNAPANDIWHHEPSPEITTSDNVEKCTQINYPIVQFSQIGCTLISQSYCNLIDPPLKFKISCFNRQLIAFPLSLTFIANNGSLKFVGAINYRAILQLQLDNADASYEYERMESTECGQCKVVKQQNCTTCVQNYQGVKTDLLKKCACHRCTNVAMNFLDRCTKNPKPCKRTFVRKRRKFGTLQSHLSLYHESISAPDYLISTKNRCDSTYMLNRTDQSVSTAILKLANILLDVKISPECDNKPQYSDWTQWTEFEIIDSHQAICECLSKTQLPQTTAEPKSINDSNFRCFEILDILESIVCLTANLTILEHPNDYNITWQLQIGPFM